LEAWYRCFRSGECHFLCLDEDAPSELKSDEKRLNPFVTKRSIEIMLKYYCESFSGNNQMGGVLVCAI
jgi:hypothetical protein